MEKGTGVDGLRDDAHTLAVHRADRTAPRPTMGGRRQIGQIPPQEGDRQSPADLRGASYPANRCRGVTQFKAADRPDRRRQRHRVTDSGPLPDRRTYPIALDAVLHRDPDQSAVPMAADPEVNRRLLEEMAGRVPGLDADQIRVAATLQQRQNGRHRYRPERPTASGSVATRPNRQGLSRALKLQTNSL